MWSDLNCRKYTFRVMKRIAKGSAVTVFLRFFGFGYVCFGWVWFRFISSLVFNRHQNILSFYIATAAAAATLESRVSITNFLFILSLKQRLMALFGLHPIVVNLGFVICLLLFTLGIVTFLVCVSFIFASFFEFPTFLLLPQLVGSLDLFDLWLFNFTNICLDVRLAFGWRAIYMSWSGRFYMG